MKERYSVMVLFRVFQRGYYTYLEELFATFTATRNDLNAWRIIEIFVCTTVTKKQTGKYKQITYASYSQGPRRLDSKYE